MAATRPASSRRARRPGWSPSFDVLAANPAELERLFRTLTERIAFLTQGGAPPALDPKFPPADSGILGPVVTPDNLTMTVSVGASLFDDRFGLAARKPVRLSRMTSVSQRRAGGGALPRRPVAAVLRQHAGHQSSTRCATS